MQRLLLSIAALCMMFVIGFGFFIARLPYVAADSDPMLGDAVIVYTGGGGKRITEAMAIFADGAGERLLISGVHPDTSRQHLMDLWIGAQTRFDCCVDLGHEALTTAGNATEAQAWAAKHEFSHVILVTSDYHMPRALAETRAQMPDVVIGAHAVDSGYLDAAGRPASAEAWEKLAGEYVKFAAARGRVFV
ncbi:MAG: YdcF family protein [Pseudomonadota bacterium]